MTTSIVLLYFYYYEHNRKFIKFSVIIGDISFIIIHFKIQLLLLKLFIYENFNLSPNGKI
jgi:hypothetical protein